MNNYSPQNVHQKKLIQYLKTFQKKEFTQFGKFLDSPYFNNSDLLVSLFKILKKHRFDFESKALTKEKIFKKLYPKERFNVKKIRDLMSDMSLLIEQFWMLEGLESNKQESTWLKSKAISKRHLKKPFRGLLNKLESSLDEQPIRDINYFRLKMDIHDHIYFHSTTEQREEGRPHLEKTMEYLDDYYLMNKMRLSLEMLSREKQNNEEFKIQRLDKVLEQAKEKAKTHPIFSIYVDCIKLSKGDFKQDDFIAFGKRFYAHQEQMNTEELRKILIPLINLSTQKFYGGEKGFEKIVLWLYKIAVKRDLFLEEGKMRGHLFINIVIIGSIMKEFEWVENFMKTHSTKILNSENLPALSIAKCFLLFHLQRFEECLESIAKIEMNDNDNKPRFFLLEIRCLYELFLIDKTYKPPLKSKILAFHKMLKKSNYLNKNKQNAYLLTLKIIKKMISFQRKEIPREMIKILLLEISPGQSVIARNWLKIKLDEL